MWSEKSKLKGMRTPGSEALVQAKVKSESRTVVAPHRRHGWELNRTENEVSG